MVGVTGPDAAAEGDAVPVAEADSDADAEADADADADAEAKAKADGDAVTAALADAVGVVSGWAVSFEQATEEMPMAIANRRRSRG